MDIIFDIDGTLADSSKRIHHLLKKPKDWDAFYSSMIDDDPIEEIIAIAHSLFYRNNETMEYNRIILATGRPEKYRDDTSFWCKKHKISYYDLYMRKNLDFRKDFIVKKEMLDQMRNEGYDPKLVFEDRESVVKMWRDEGLRCMQVDCGKF